MEWATLAGPVESELLIKKSRFLGRVMPVSGRAEAYAEVARLKALHPGARTSSANTAAAATASTSPTARLTRKRKPHYTKH